VWRLRTFVAQTVTVGEQKVCPESLKFSTTPTPQVENPFDSDSTALLKIDLLKPLLNRLLNTISLKLHVPLVLQSVWKRCLDFLEINKIWCLSQKLYLRRLTQNENCTSLYDVFANPVVASDAWRSWHQLSSDFLRLCRTLCKFRTFWEWLHIYVVQWFPNLFEPLPKSR